MKRTTTLVALLLGIAILAGMLAACSSDEVTTATETTATTTLTTTTTTTTTETAAWPKTVTDQLGRTVTIDAIPQTIVSLAPSNTEILFALGLGDRMEGRTDYCNYPAEAGSVPSIGGFSTPNIEEIVALEPDLIVATTMHETEIIPQLEDFGFTVVGLDPTNLEETIDAITLVGDVTGTEDTAAGLTTDMQARIEAITARTANLATDDIRRVLYIVWHDPFMAAGAGTFHDVLIKASGGTNIAGDAEGYPTLDMETVIGADPEIMIAGVGMGDGEDLPLQYLMDEERLSNTTARQNGAVYPIDMDIVGRAGPRIVEALEQFAAYIHPELFE